MRSLTRVWLLAVLVAVTLVLGPIGPAQAQKKKKNTKTVTFKTYDGVELTGTLYPNATGKRDAVVLLLHNFDHKKGGSRSQEGWDELATALQADGYAVLSFDFRGFGDSKTVNNQVFWSRKNPHNAGASTKKRKGDTIDQKDFSTAYYPYLVNDIAAARAYLDRRNDANEVNTSSIIVIGAGQGASLGAMWLAHESRRRRDKTPNPNLLTRPMLGDPEVKDVACGIWVSISPTIGSRRAYLGPWLAEAGKIHKVPQAFVLSKTDSKGENLTNLLLRNIKSNKKLEKELKFTGKELVAGGKLSGNSLLKLPATQSWVKKYLVRVLEARGAKERLDRKTDKFRYYYVLPNRTQRLQKPAGEEVGWVDVGQFIR